MKKIRACERCSEDSSLYCASDSTFLCFRYVAKVHQANFLIARHVRQVLCFKCEAFSDYRISGAENDCLQWYYCLACSPEDEFASDYNSSASSSECILSSELCVAGPKRVELENRSKDEKKKKKVAKLSVLSSVTKISGGGDDLVFPVKISVKKMPFFLFQASSCLHVFFFFLKFKLCLDSKKVRRERKD
ncbi:B-box zinc finger protein 32 [Quercus suber]|uniref:B-box zinc finger protein 32 n=1 Tax=Quercus suber TaxID=58331 RepID=UPI000CE1C65E|nr:B-box zinc finger protein 32-like [Quercus suber]POE85153.1 b-box zinc finger protein 32 [Quercus suber]